MEADFDDLDRVRAELEASISKLRQSLKHWQRWEAEYEGLREGLSELQDNASKEELEEVATDCEGVVLNGQEIKKLLKGQSRQRTPKEIVGLLSRRIDYVQTNVKSVEKLLETEQKKLDQANFLNHRDESGLPLMEITEDLDDEGNVVSSSTSKPGEHAPELLDALRKSGVLVREDETDKMKEEDAKNPGIENQKSSLVEQKANALPTSFEAQDKEEAEPNAQSRRPSKRKSVSFAETSAIIEVPSQPHEAPKQIGHVKIKDCDDSSESSVIEPVGETPEEMALRREMLEYSLNEVGAVVAEMDLYEETDDEVDDEEDIEGDDDDEDPDEDHEYLTEDENEDDFGRTTVKVMNNKYRKKMLELEQKLNAKSLVNVGPDASFMDKVNGDAGMTQKDDEQNSKTKSPSSKGVRFAETLDVQEAPSSLPGTPASTVKKLTANPLATEILERGTDTPSMSSGSQPQKKLSRFKASRVTASTRASTETNPIGNLIVNGPLADSNLKEHLVPATQMAKQPISIPTAFEQTPRRIVPEGPPGKTHSNNIVERPMEETSDYIGEPDDLDPELHHQQIATEYHRMRNKFIQRQGGFMQQDSEELEDENGRPKMSRFKAARLGKSHVTET